MATTATSRRRFIVALFFFPLLLSGLVRYLKPSVPVRKTLKTVLLSTIPVNGALVFRESRIALLRDESRISAVSLVCTHLGCTVSVLQDEMVCPCHGSRFNLKGEVVKGPADRSLPHYEVEIKGEQVYVYG